MTEHISEDELLNLVKKLNLEPTKEQSDITVTNRPRDASPDVDGTVKIEHNKIIVTDPGETGSFAVLQCAYPLKIKKNGRWIDGKEIVISTDKLEWEIETTPLYKIDISKDKMTAHFHLYSLERYDWRLKPIESGNQVIIEAEEDRTTVLQTIHLTDIMTELHKMHVTKNLKPSALFQELQHPTYKPILVASGVEPIPSKDAQLQLFFSENVESSFTEIGGAIDFRSHLKIPSVNKGDCIAKKIPPIEGTIGYDIFGNIVKPVPPRDIVIIAKENVEITPNGEVIALNVGRPRITGHNIKYFDISTAYVISGDVDLKTGNIVFSGDVIVYGNVTDGMIIESLGNVYISGNVYRATITATGSITIKGNIIGSNLYSGYFGVLFNRLYSSSKKLLEFLSGLLEASKLLISIVEGKGKSVTIGQVVLSLIESKYKEIPATVKEILGCIQSVQNISANELNDVKMKLDIFLHPLKLVNLVSLNSIISINNIVQDTFQTIERMQEHQVQIDINQCHLSNLKSNGNIIIHKEGVLQSNLYSKENILFHHSDSVCRGSQLEAGGTISANYVGGETGGETVLKAGKKIFVKKMYGGRVWVDRGFQDLLEPLEDIAVYYRQNKLVFEKDSPQP